MKSKYYSTWIQRMAVLVFVLLGSISTLLAETKLYIEDFSISAGETKKVAVCLDTDEEILNKSFGVNELMEGYSYSDFACVFRNYFKQAKDKYHPIFLASRNAYDFQDLFITQDFGPVYVTDQVFGVYRCRSVAGESNYNSIMSTEKIDLDKIHVCRVMAEFYQGRYDLSPRILTAQRALFQNAVLARSADAEQFVLSQLSVNEKRQMPFSMARYVVWRAWKKLRREPYEVERRANLLQKTGE